MRKRICRAGSVLLLCALLAGTLAAPAAAAAQYRDVPDGHPAEEAVRRCTELGFFQGKGDSFGVGRPLTRSAFVTVLCRFFGWEEVRPAAPTYADVSADDWCYGAVEAAAANGAVTAQSRDFRPNDAITREELAVMLVRALGYETIAGLAQDLPVSYRDIRTNRGYLTVASDLGLLESASPFALSPGETVLREEAAEILMRTYDKLHSPASGEIAVLSSGVEAPDLAGCGAGAVPAVKLMCAGGPSVVNIMKEAEADALRDSVRRAGAKALLYVVGGPTALNGDSGETAQVLAEAVSAKGYDGLVLDIARQPYSARKALTALSAALRDRLGGRMLCVVVEAPSWRQETYKGYDYVALSQTADRLILRCASYDGRDGAIPIAPQSPLEEVYYALGELTGSVDPARLSLLVDTQGVLYLDGKDAGELSRAELGRLLDRRETSAYRSPRYGSCYLTTDYLDQGTVRAGVAWYLDGQSIRERAALLGLFGVEHMCFTSLDDLPADYRS